MKLVIQKKSLTEFEDIENAIIDNDQTFEQMHETWKILDDFFAQNSYEQDVEWRLTYFRVYVRLTWKVLGTIIDTNKFVEIMRRQVPMAILLDVDVLKEMMWYFEFNKSDEKQLVSLYQKIKTAFLESEQVVGVWQGKPVLVKDLVSEYLSLHKRGASSMEGAEFLSKLDQVMFPEEVDLYAFVEYDVGIDRFLELVEFFEKTSNEQIWFVVDAFLNPEKYGVNNSENILVKEEVKAEVAVPNLQDLGSKYESMSQKLEEEVKALEKTVAPAVKSEPEKPAVIKPLAKEIAPTEPVAPPKLTSEQIKSKIESEFKKDTEGNFEDIEGVMRKLEEFTEMYNDPKIADMIYFDEDDNKFKWKV